MQKKIMNKLNDYLYAGDTVLKILQRYAKDLKQSAKETANQIDLLHCNVLLQIAELLQHNEFLTSQSQRILGYEKRQERARAKRDAIPKGENIYFDEAYERVITLQQLELSQIDVNMFAAVDNSLINDGCGLYRGRLILPYEHLSRFQNDLID